MSCSITLASTLSCLATSAQIRLARQERGGFERSPGATGVELFDGVAAGASRYRSIPVPLVSAADHATTSATVVLRTPLPGTSAQCEDREPQANLQQLGVGLCGCPDATLALESVEHILLNESRCSCVRQQGGNVRHFQIGVRLWR